MLAAERLLKLEVIGGLYEPLGAVNVKERRPRGLVRGDDERLDGLNLVGKDRLGDDEFTEQLERAEAQARQVGAELRRGEIGRRPLGGACPKYCTFQPICRLERAVGLEEENGNGGSE